MSSIPAIRVYMKQQIGLRVYTGGSRNADPITASRDRLRGKIVFTQVSPKGALKSFFDRIGITKVFVAKGLWQEVDQLGNVRGLPSAVKRLPKTGDIPRQQIEEVIAVALKRSKLSAYLYVGLNEAYFYTQDQLEQGAPANPIGGFIGNGRRGPHTRGD